MPKTVSHRGVVRKKVKPARARTPSGIRTYQSAVKYLNTKTNYETMLRVGYNHTNFNLSRMLRILAGIGNPHKQFRSLHIAGTKGKGSTCTMLATMLRHAGYRTGLYTSPHFIELRERIAVDGHMVSEAEFARLIAKVSPVVNRLASEGPTFFEIMTAAAFLHFAQQEVDFAVIETGLGGRLDSTNVIKPEVCGIVNISYDHVAQLGNTLEKIAEEKAGIFKSGVPAIVAPQPAGVKRVFKRVAEKVGADLRILGEDLEFSYRFESSRAAGPHIRICMNTLASRFEHLQVPMLGEHQALNLGVALGMIDALRRDGVKINEQQVMDGLARLKIEGRMEFIRQQPRTLVDAAHNAASVAALMHAIGQNVSYDSMVVIFGCSADKDINGMLQQLQLGADKVIFTNNGSVRSADPRELYNRFMEISPKMAQVADELSDAYRIARTCVTRDDLICITGSVYLVGKAKRLAAAGAFD